MTAASWQNQKGSGTVQVHRIIEVLTVLLLALATVGSAWCAYQVSQWNGMETDAARASAVARINGSREYALATQKVAYDAASVAQYAEAVVDGNEPLQTFLRTSIIRPGLPPVARRVAGLHRRDRRAAAEPRRERGVSRGPVRQVDRVRRSGAGGDHRRRRCRSQRRRLHRHDAVHGERAVLRRRHGVVLQPDDAHRRCSRRRR